MRNRLCFLLFASLLISSARAQTAASVVVRDPNAVALAARSLQAMAGITALKDITLQANATYIAGSDEEMGTATLVALGNQQSLVTLSLTAGQRQELRNRGAGVWSGPDGTPHALAMHNCIIDPDWFFPALSLSALAYDPTLIITLVGLESRAGESVYHLSLYHNLPETIPNVAMLAAQMSAMDLYLDAASFLPVALDFNDHLDADANTNFVVEIRFGAYQSFSGVRAPTQIQKYVQNSLVLNLTISSAMVNSGVPASVFTLPYIPAGGAQ